MSTYKDLYGFFIKNLEETFYEEDMEKQSNFLAEAYAEATDTGRVGIDMIAIAISGYSVETAINEQGNDFCLNYLYEFAMEEQDDPMGSEDHEKQTDYIIKAWTALSNEDKSDVDKALIAISGYSMKSALELAETVESEIEYEPTVENSQNTP